MSVLSMLASLAVLACFQNPVTRYQLAPSVSLYVDLSEADNEEVKGAVRAVMGQQDVRYVLLDSDNTSSLPEGEFVAKLFGKTFRMFVSNRSMINDLTVAFYPKLSVPEEESASEIDEAMSDLVARLRAIDGVTQVEVRRSE